MYRMPAPRPEENRILNPATPALVFPGELGSSRPLACASAPSETPRGFAAGTSTATVILTSSHLGFPLSTTQVATGSILGAGAARGAGTVHWGVGGQVAFAWLLTLPAAAAFGAVAAWMADTGPLGTIIVAIVLIGVAGGIYAVSRRRPVTADNVNDLPAQSPQVVVAA